MTWQKKAYIPVAESIKMRQMFIEREILGRITLVAGGALIAAGMLFIGGTFSDFLVLSLSWSFGAILFVIGLVVGFDLFAYSTRIGKIGTLLMSASAVIMIGGLILFNLKTIDIHITSTTDVYFKGRRVPNVFISEIRPFAGTFIFLALIALGFFAAGLALKLYDDVF